MIFTAWGAEGVSTLIVGETLPESELVSSPGMTLLKRFEAKSWNDVMRQYHEWQGWDPYKPMLDENGQEYLEDDIEPNP